MDDPLVPKQYGSLKWVFLLLGGGSLIFILTSVVLTAVSGMASWIVAAIGLLIAFTTTCLLIRWIRDGQLEEAKHTYLAVSQVVSLMLISGALVALLYGGPSGTYPVVGVVTGAKTSPNLPGDVGQITLNEGAPVTLPYGWSMPFVLAEGLSNGTAISVKISQQPSQAFCRVTNGNGGTVQGVYNKINVSCVPKYNIGGQVIGLQTVNTPLQLKAQIFVHNSPISTTVSVAQSGQFYFPVKADPDSSFTVSVVAQPTNSDNKPYSCTTSSEMQRINHRDNLDTKIMCNPPSSAKEAEEAESNAQSKTRESNMTRDSSA